MLCLRITGASASSEGLLIGVNRDSYMDNKGGLVLYKASAVVIRLCSNHYPVRICSKGCHCVHNSSAVLSSKVIGQLGIIFKDGENGLQ